MRFLAWLLKELAREIGWLLLFPFMLAIYPFVKISLWLIDKYEEWKRE